MWWKFPEQALFTEPFGVAMNPALPLIHRVRPGQPPCEFEFVHTS